jgi:Zn-dependent protease
MKGSFNIGRIAGIQIGIHYTWIFALVLFTWLFAGTFHSNFPTWSTTTYWIAGLIVSLGLFVSVLIHELCQSLVAISRGMQVKSIVLFIFGGVSNIEKEPERPWVEFIMAGAGPASSLVLGGALLGISYALFLPNNVFSSLGQAGPLVVILFYSGYINV